jgi:23S rRNA (guanosine2251-2'-O)-methyltransferase
MTKADFVCGLHAVESLLRARPGSVDELLVAEGRTDRRLGELLESAVAGGITVTRLPRCELDVLLPGSRHQGVIARLGSTAAALKEADIQPFLEALDHEPLLLVLDGVQDPHNLGACLRTADAAGVDAVGVWLYGASDAADSSLYDADFSGPLALVLGGEGTGLRRLTQDLCDFQVAIPMAGRVSSLNVSVAAGVLLYEARRQRKK